jgi:hypothetical protein
MRTVRTTMQPDVEIEVSETEYVDLARQRLLVEQPEDVPLAPILDLRFGAPQGDPSGLAPDAPSTVATPVKATVKETVDPSQSTQSAEPAESTKE